MSQTQSTKTSTIAKELLRSWEEGQSQAAEGLVLQALPEACDEAIAKAATIHGVDLVTELRLVGEDNVSIQFPTHSLVQQAA